MESLHCFSQEEPPTGLEGGKTILTVWHLPGRLLMKDFRPQLNKGQIWDHQFLSCSRIKFRGPVYLQYKDVKITRSITTVAIH